MPDRQPRFTMIQLREAFYGRLPQSSRSPPRRWFSHSGNTARRNDNTCCHHKKRLLSSQD